MVHECLWYLCDLVFTRHNVIHIEESVGELRPSLLWIVVALLRFKSSCWPYPVPRQILRVQCPRCYTCGYKWAVLYISCESVKFGATIWLCDVYIATSGEFPHHMFCILMCTCKTEDDILLSEDPETKSLIWKVTLTKCPFWTWLCFVATDNIFSYSLFF